MFPDIYVQFVSYVFSQVDVKGEKDVERGEDPKNDAEEEEKRCLDYLPECIQECLAFPLFLCLACLCLCEKDKKSNFFLKDFL